MISISEKSTCCGCNACAQNCPKQCITMQKDEEGFLYPSVNEKTCIRCDLCNRVCPINKQAIQNMRKPLAYAAYALKKEIRLQSSSGGIFTLLAEYVLDQNGVVFGAAYDDNWMVHHICIEDKNELWKLRGSKYLQSRVEDTYKIAKKALVEGKMVLYSGVACQISGLKSFLGKEYDNLVTVDVLCHGVPTPKLWEKYIRQHMQQQSSCLKAVSFREKNLGWKRFSMKLVFENQSVYTRPFTQDDFMKLFLKNICLRPSCYDCRFKGINRESDLTIGDFWGIENVLPDMDDDQGTSVVLIQSEKGQQIFKELSKKMRTKEIDVEIALPITAESRHSVAEHPKRKVFFEKIDRWSIDKCMKLLKPSVKTRIARKIKRVIGKK